MGVKITVAGANKMKRKNNAAGLGDVAGEGKSLIKTLIREIGIPATLGLIGAALASVWTKRGPDGKYGPMFALTAVALAWGVPRFLLRSLNIGFLDRKTAERAGAFAVAFAMGWDTVIAPLVSGNRDHIVSKIVRWAQELVAKDPASVDAALQHGGNSYGGGAEHSFSYQGGQQTPAQQAVSQGSGGGGGSASSGGGGGATTADFIAAGGQALGAILSGVGALAGGLRGGSGETAGGTSGMAGPGRSVIARAIRRG